MTIWVAPNSASCTQSVNSKMWCGQLINSLSLSALLLRVTEKNATLCDEDVLDRWWVWYDGSRESLPFAGASNSEAAGLHLMSGSHGGEYATNIVTRRLLGFGMDLHILYEFLRNVGRLTLYVPKGRTSNVTYDKVFWQTDPSLKETFFVKKRRYKKPRAFIRALQQKKRIWKHGVCCVPIAWGALCVRITWDMWLFRIQH